MKIVLYQTDMNLAKRDEQFMQIQDLIESKSKMILEKEKKLRFISKQNHFLDEVRKDYEKHYNYIREQKKNQIIALQLLNNYINDLTTSAKLTENNIADAKEEQKKIMREIKSIKHGLDSINTNIEGINTLIKNNT